MSRHMTLSLMIIDCNFVIYFIKGDWDKVQGTHLTDSNT